MITFSDARIIIIAGGSFQGKSTISLKLAAYFGMSGVLTTDIIRNILKVLNPDADYFSTSTYLLSEELLQKQMNKVCSVIKELIGIYQTRGEHIIIEGMHFSEEFISWASSQDFLNICLDNSLPLSKRIVLKGKTRSKLRFYDSLVDEYYFQKVDDSNVTNSSYLKYQNKIDQIHRILLHNCRLSDFHIIEFNNINQGIELSIQEINSWLEYFAPK